MLPSLSLRETSSTSIDVAALAGVATNGCSTLAGGAVFLLVVGLSKFCVIDFIFCTLAASASSLVTFLIGSKLSLEVAFFLVSLILVLILERLLALFSVT